MRAAEDRRPEPTAAAIVCPILPDARSSRAAERDPAARVAEAVGLAEAIALDVRLREGFVVRQPAPATLLGSGAVARLKEAIAEHDIAVAVVDSRLTPVQQRNLERAWQCKVIDRTGLILEIFGERARTHEGTLQVELAALDYQRSRLVRSWTHLERQRGGFGFLGGPGESQLEIDRRLIGDRILKIKRELEQVRRTRALHRAGRKRGAIPTVAFVGYTNAGKSTLFNRIAGAGVLAQDLLFATLDPTMRAIRLPNGQRAILSDTVGFIADLPTTLVAAFRATLEEVLEADLIVHVRDVAHPDSEQQKHDVEAVLGQLGLEDRMAAGDVIEALNKIDLLDDEARQRLEVVAATGAERRRAFAISAATGEGVEALLAAIGERLSAADQSMEVDVPLTDGATIAWLYRHGEVRARRDADDVAHFTVALDAEAQARLAARLGHGHRP
ncbi:GTPase HflX [Reyranella sp. CPCC 100927]|uniref:GTPase HflX n=1 Tax=Reyranella sp. CPCC 100927 TaxID=2599616 RepID=UPI0011B41E50|nr:GTPase HflX [Reyranella sp. CPCC 100927]TWT10728.1 GTPase HflX [Reyranella sp. CPCC 100927]